MLAHTRGIAEKLGTLAFLLLLGSAPAAADSTPPGEYEVKAAFIHNFANFVVWAVEAQASAPMRLCVLGADPFGNALDVIRGKSIGATTWEIQFVRTPDELTECRVLFIAASETGRLEEILAALGGRAILTLGDSEGFAERGVMINFYLENRKVRFEINIGAARGAGLSISSQLLKLARIVRGEDGHD